MRRSGLISLITDFGMSDTYVGQMKGVMLGIAPEIRIVDLTHAIPPQDIMEAAFQLATAWSAFPEGTVHLVVVDPGVGTPRRPIAFEHARHIFVMPDNGLATFVLAGVNPERVVELSRPEYHRPAVARTFHGRDVFAPIAAHLAAGRDLHEIGRPVPADGLVKLDMPSIERSPHSVRGPVVSIDHFGNCRTLIGPEDVRWPRSSVWVRCGRVSIRGIVDTYAAVPHQHTLALFGSHGGLEIAVREGNAARAWDIKRGMIVEVSEGG